MNVRPWVALLLLAACFAPTLARAQAPAGTTDVYTGSLGGGFALTGGNTDTSNFNITANIVRDPGAGNVIKASIANLRGNQDDALNLDRTSALIRDEYSLSDRTFLFGQVDYMRDRFKEIIFLWVPAAGVGYKVINTDATLFAIDASGGALIEKNPGLPSDKTGSLIAGERFEHQLSTAARVTHSLSSIWKTNDFADSLTNFSVGLATTLVGNLEVKLEFIDTYKNKPADPSLEKNDTAFVTAFVVKF